MGPFSGENGGPTCNGEGRENARGLQWGRSPERRDGTPTCVGNLSGRGELRRNFGGTQVPL